MPQSSNIKTSTVRIVIYKFSRRIYYMLTECGRVQPNLFPCQENPSPNRWCRETNQTSIWCFGCDYTTHGGDEHLTHLVQTPYKHNFKFLALNTKLTDDRKRRRTELTTCPLDD